MRISLSRRMYLAAGAWCLSAVLTGAQAGVAQQAAPAATPTHPAPSVAPAAASAGAGAAGDHTSSGNGPAAPAEKTRGEGFRVHGHWVLDLKNPDGTLVSHREFENALVQASGGALAGDQILTALLSGNAVSGGPAIAFVSGTPATANLANQCDLGAAPPLYYSCQLFVVAGSQFAAYTGVVIGKETGLQAEASFQAGTVNWVLSGNYTVPTASPSSIASVGTLMSLCVASGATFAAPLLWSGTSSDGTGTVAPTVCAPANPATGKAYLGTLTFTTIPGVPLAVTPGQMISVKVTISFS